MRQYNTETGPIGVVAENLHLLKFAEERVVSYSLE